MRPIDADDLLMIIENFCGDYDCHDSESFDKTAVRMAIRSAPTLSLWDVAGQRALTAGRYMPAEIAVEILRNANLGGVLKDAAECLISIAEQSAVAQSATAAPAAEDGLRTDLISRAAAVRIALQNYRAAQEAVCQCREKEDEFGILAFSGQKESFRWMVMALMALPAAEPTRRARMNRGDAEGGGGTAAE